MKTTTNLESVLERKTTIYETTYKKGNVLSKMRWAHEGDLDSAVPRIKEYLSKHCLRHIHTVHFLVDIDQNGYGAQHLEEIDVND